ncbi:HAD-IIB family hydrolase [Croceicoccus mobilis]|nr:HAD-IIB family hydrolase [Croceicoccus mobilis]
MAIALGGCLRAPPVEYGITEDTGGHITYVLGAMEALARREDVSHAEIVTRLIEDRQLGPSYAKARERTQSGVTITRIDSGNRAYLSKEALASDLPAFKTAFLAELRRRKVRPDIIHAHFADAAEIARAARDEFGIPFIYTAHSLGLDKGDSDRPEHRERIAAESRAMATADAIIASSRDECERQIPAYSAAKPGRIHRVVPGAGHAPASDAETDGARELITPFLRYLERPIVLAIARAVHKKNLVTLVEAFAGCPGLRDKANLVVVAGLRRSVAQGEREQQEVMAGIVDAIDRHDLHGSVAWPRRHSQADIAGLYALARKGGGVFVNPARIEPYGLTLVEAAAHGVPVVATRQGGPVDIVAELEHGLLVDPHDTDDIGRAIMRLLDDRDLWQKCSWAGFENASTMDWNAYARDFLAIAQDITATRRPSLPERMRGVKSPALERPTGVETLILSDIDNTLTGCPCGAGALRRWLRPQQQIAFGIATGRSLHEAMRILRQWEFETPEVLITDVGSGVWWRGQHGLDRDEAYDRHIAAGWTPQRVLRQLRGMAGLSLQREIDQSPFKLSFTVSGPDVARAVREKLAKHGLAAKVVFSHGDMLDILPIRAGKAGAMKHVARVLGLPLQQVIAIGDSGNDLDMLTECPNAVLVGNHDAELSALATSGGAYVARSHHAGGALEGILHSLSAARPSRPADDPPISVDSNVRTAA